MAKTNDFVKYGTVIHGGIETAEPALAEMRSAISLAKTAMRSHIGNPVSGMAETLKSVNEGVGDAAELLPLAEHTAEYVESLELVFHLLEERITVVEESLEFLTAIGFELNDNYPNAVKECTTAPTLEELNSSEED